MRVVIIGAGEVGTEVAESLADDHTVTVVDIDERRAEQLKFDLDVLTVVGDGTTLETLKTAEVGDADIFLACTDNDLANLVACGTAEALGDPFSIARTKSVEYLRVWEHDQRAFSADFVVCSDLLAAENIVRLVGVPSAKNISPFASGLVHVAEFDIAPDSSVTGETVAEADRFEGLTFAGLFRDGELLLPSGATRIEAGDRVVVIGSPESVYQFGVTIDPDTTADTADEVVVVGGSEIGYQTASLLEKRKIDTTLIEADEERARWLAEQLAETLVLEHDPTDTDFLVREHVDEADILVATLGSDERNLLVSVLGKRIGVDRVVAVVENPEYVDLFEEISIDVAVNPRVVTAEEIIRFSFDGVAENLSVLGDAQATVLELRLEGDSELAGRPLRELDADVDGEFVIGAITRDRSLLVPRGDTELRPGDHIVVFAEPDVASALAAMA